MTQILLAGLGGFVGAALRYGGTELASRLHTGPGFTYATLIVNVLGCLAIGLLGGLSEARGLLSPEARAFLLVGILGGFTTFSTFGFETLQLVRAGHQVIAMANVVLHLVLGLGAVWAGWSLARA